VAATEARFLSTEEVAERLQVDEQTIRRWIKSGKLEAVKPGREWRIPPTAFEALLESYSSPKVRAPQQLEFEEQAGHDPDEERRYLLALFDKKTSLMRKATEYYGPRLDELPEEPPLEELKDKHAWVLDFDVICVLLEQSINTQHFKEIAESWVDCANEESTPPDIRHSVEAFQHAFNDLLGTRHSQARAWIRKQKARYPKYAEEGIAEIAEQLLHTSDERLSKARG
jgi:excisionase family DNA binding protein